MYSRRYVPAYYLDSQLSSNFKRLQQLAELQSKMVLQDLNNNELHDRLFNLQSENDLLKKRLMAKYTPPSSAIDLKERKETAIDRAIEILRKKKEQFTKIPNSQHTKSNSRIDQSWPEKVQCRCKKQSKRTHKNNRTMSHIECQSPESAVKLDKNVYFSLSDKKAHLSSSVPPKQSSHQRELTFKKEDDSKSIFVEVHNKFPSKVNQFEGKIAHDRFQQCENRVADNSEASHMWNSEYPIGIKSNLFDRLDKSSQRRKKTFLSVVSQSSVGKKN